MDGILSMAILLLIIGSVTVGFCLGYEVGKWLERRRAEEEPEESLWV